MAMTQEKRRVLFFVLGFLFVTTVLLYFVNIVEATGTGASLGALPWEKALTGLAASL